MPGGTLHHSVHISGHGAFAEASELIAAFGDLAGREAQARASRSRDLGNVIHFCRWREVGRMIATLGDSKPTAIVH